MEWENKITTGNILTIAGMVAAMIMGYANLQGEQARQGDRVSVLETTIHDRITAADANRTATDTRLRSLEIGQAGQGADLRNIQAGVTRIESAVDALSKKIEK